MKAESEKPKEFATAHEVLVGVFPAHIGHTLVRKNVTSSWAQLRCSCGATLDVSQHDCAVHGIAFTALLHGVRNVPTEH
jgi:hypothetical protein